MKKYQREKARKKVLHASKTVKKEQSVKYYDGIEKSDMIIRINVNELILRLYIMINTVYIKRIQFRQ